jgi:hypothetical protein
MPTTGSAPSVYLNKTSDRTRVRVCDENGRARRGRTSKKASAPLALAHHTDSGHPTLPLPLSSPTAYTERRGLEAALPGALPSRWLKGSLGREGLAL